MSPTSIQSPRLHPPWPHVCRAPSLWPPLSALEARGERGLLGHHAGARKCVTAGARTQPTCCLPLTVEVTGPHEPGSWSLMEQLLWESRDPAGLTIPFYRGRNRDPGTFFTRDWLGDRQALGLRSLKAPNTLKSLDTGSPSSSGKGYKCSYFRCADMPRDSAVV